MPQRTLITARVLGRLCKAIRKGATYEMACKYAGVHYTTMRRWTKNAEEIIDKIQELRGDDAPLVIRSREMLPSNISDVIEAEHARRQALEQQFQDEMLTMVEQAAGTDIETVPVDSNGSLSNAIPDVYVDGEPEPNILVLSEFDKLTVWAYLMITQAEAEAVDKWLGHIEDAAEDGEWQAAAWKLERRYPHEYGRRQQIKHQGNVEHEHVMVYIPDNKRDRQAPKTRPDNE